MEELGGDDTDIGEDPAPSQVMDDGLLATAVATEAIGAHVEPSGGDTNHSIEEDLGVEELLEDQDAAMTQIIVIFI